MTTASNETWRQDPPCCLGCGQPDRLQVMMWVTPYTGEVDWGELPFDLYDDPESSGITASFCHRCEEDHGTALMSDIAQVFNLLGVLTTGEALWIPHATCPTCYRQGSGRPPEGCDDDTPWGCGWVRHRFYQREAA